MWALVIVYIGSFGWLSVTRYHAFSANAYDLGNVNQAAWNTVHGRPLYFTNWRGVELNLATDNRLAMHVEPIYFLIAPIYWLWQQPETLLILQTVVLALGAWPVFWLARERLESDLAGVAFAAVYLLFPGLQAANLWEFHAVALAAPLLLYAFYFGQAGRWALFWLFAVLAMMTKEEIPLTGALMGMYFVFWGLVRPGYSAQGGQDGLLPRLRRPPAIHGLILTALATLWFVVAVLVVVPHFEGRGSPYLEYYGDTGDGVGGIAGALIAQPGAVLERLFSARNVEYLIDLFTPVGFLSLCSPLTLTFALPDLAINLLSSHEPMHFVEKYHYVAPLLPGVMIAAILGTSWLARRMARIFRAQVRVVALLLTAVILGLTLYYHHYHGYTPLARAFEPYRVTAHHRLGARLAREIPRTAAVSAQPNLNPQVSGRKTLYRFPYVGDADTIFLDVSTLDNQGQQYELVQQLLDSGDFGVLRAEDGYLVLRRGAPAGTSLPDAFYSFARTASPPAPQYPVDITFGEALRLIGFDLAYGRRTEMPQTPLRFVLYWQVLKPAAEDLGITLYLLDRDRRVIGSTDPAIKSGIQTWYPTSRWRPGETVKMEIAAMPWWTAQYDRYSVGLGVQGGLDAWDVGARLRPQINASSMALPYADDETLVNLIDFRTDVGGMPVPLERPRLFNLPRNVTRTPAKWDGGPELLGYDLSGQRLRPGGDLDVSLYWQTVRPMEHDYKVFVHLVKDGSLTAQHDAAPDLGGFPTTKWQEREIIRDRHPLHLPADLPEGSYSLHIGWYDPATGARLTLSDGTDAFVLPAGVSVTR